MNLKQETRASLQPAVSQPDAARGAGANNPVCEPVTGGLS